MKKWIMLYINIISILVLCFLYYESRSLIKIFTILSTHNIIPLQTLLAESGSTQPQSYSRFLIYGFTDFTSQLNTLDFAYSIIEVNPTPMIIADFSSEEEAQRLIPQDLQYRIYYID